MDNIVLTTTWSLKCENNLNSSWQIIDYICYHDISYYVYETFYDTVFDILAIIFFVFIAWFTVLKLAFKSIF
jgi:hypothetical protein